LDVYQRVSRWHAGNCSDVNCPRRCNGHIYGVQHVTTSGVAVKASGATATQAGYGALFAALSCKADIPTCGNGNQSRPVARRLGPIVSA